MRRAIIVGGGISGLSAAYQLARRGIPSTLIERRPRLGGVIQTEVVENCVLEAGPDSFLSAKPWAMDLIRELGLANEVIGSNDHLRVTYVWKDGRLVALPDGLMLMVPTKILPLATTGLLGWPTKLRMALEWFRRPAGVPAKDRSVAEFIEDHYGQEAVDYLAEPLLSGVYGGDPRQLSVGSVLSRFVELESTYGSLTRGVLAERKRMRAGAGAQAPPLFRTMKSGLSQLTSALREQAGGRLEVLHAVAETVEPAGKAGYQVRLNGDWMNAENLVLACQAYEAGEAVAGLDPGLAALLGKIQYTSSLTLALVYDKRTFNRELNGFGFLVPKRERRLLVACTWVGTKFSHRVPEDKVVLRCFMGGSGGEAALEQPDETLVAAVRAELEEIMGVRVAPAFHRLARWPRSMAQYTVGHAARVEAIAAALNRHPGLHLAGNGYHGIGIPDCVRMGRQAADRISGRSEHAPRPAGPQGARHDD